MKQEMMGWQWHQLEHKQIICALLQTDNHASTSSLKFFTGQMPFLPPNQQCQSHEGKTSSRNTTTLHPFNGLFSRTPERETILDFTVARDVGGSGINWTICKSFAPRNRQITTPVPHHTVFFTGRMPCLSCHPTNSVKALKAQAETICKKLAATLWWFTAAPKPLKIQVFWGSRSPHILGDTTRPGHVTCVVV